MIKDITGQKFGKLMVTKYIEKYKWECICDCGNKTVVVSGNLKNGNTKSCGCLLKESSRKTHGMSGTRFMATLQRLKKRCTNSNHAGFKNYGGRGIKCLWKSSEDFRDDMYESYLEHVEEFGEKNTTIERIDVNGHYSKKNCKWATHKEQGRNRRNNRLITFRGETKCVSEWAEQLDIKVATLRYRLFRYNWSIEKAFTKKTFNS